MKIKKSSWIGGFFVWLVSMMGRNTQALECNCWVQSTGRVPPMKGWVHFQWFTTNTDCTLLNTGSFSTVRVYSAWANCTSIPGGGSGSDSGSDSGGATVSCVKTSVSTTHEDVQINRSFCSAGAVPNGAPGLPFAATAD